MLAPGDLIFHPRHGFGTISGMTRRDPIRPIQDVVVSDGVTDLAQDYYDIQLTNGGTLLVPVNRAKRVGLRLLTNGLDAITMCLQSPAQSLSGDARERAAELWARGQVGEPTALAASVRDMVTQSRGRVSHRQRERVAQQVLRAPQHRSCTGRWHFQIGGARCHLGSGETTEHHVIPETICVIHSLELREPLGDKVDAHR